MVSNSQELERRLWEAADQLRANSKLRVGEYSVPVQGLIFLKYADTRFEEATNFLSGMTTGRRQTGPLDYQARGVLYLPEKARYSHLVNLPEGENIGQAINDAMKLIESENAALKDVLPKTYNRMENFLLVELLRIFNSIPMDIEGDMFGRIYEYFLGKFAAAEGQRAGEFFTPTSLVKLIVEIVEPYHGRILDPACGSPTLWTSTRGTPAATSASTGRRRQPRPCGWPR
jgi:type I restriction enzyme M protein